MARTTTFSARFDVELVDRLDARARRAGEPKSRLAERYIDEGMRVEEHPGIVFRDGPAGRRPGLVGGPDIWEVVGALRAAPERGEQAVLHAANHLGLTPAQVRAALGYYAAYPVQIDGWIRRNDEEAEAAETAWRRAQATLG